MSSLNILNESDTSEFCQDSTAEVIKFEDTASEDNTKTSNSIGPSESNITNAYESEDEPGVTKPIETKITKALF